MQLLYTNNAGSTLRSSINNTQTSAVLATGGGSLFPNPGAGQAFFLTFTDAATQEVREIVLVTARAGDALTIVRGQQGTTARPWGAGDIAALLWTEGNAEGLIQPDQFQSGVYAVATSGGSANAITATLNSGLLALPDMMALTVPATAANTGAVNLTLTLQSASGSTVLPAHAIHKLGNVALSAGDIPAAGYPIELVWSNTFGAYVMTNPAALGVGSLTGGGANQVVYQSAPNVTAFVPAPTIAGQVLAWTGAALAWLAAAVTSFNGRSGAVVPQTGDYTAAQVGAVPLSAFQSPNFQSGNPGFVVLPNGVIMQWGNQATGGARDTVFFPKIFPNACDAVVVSANNQSSAIYVSPPAASSSSFQYQVAASHVSWIAFGH